MLKTTLIGHACLLIQSKETTILTDPVWFDYLWEEINVLCPSIILEKDKVPPLDVLNLSHRHQDHFDVRTLAYLVQNKRIITPNTIILAPKDNLLLDILNELEFKNIQVVADFEKIQVKDVTIIPTPSRNHPREVPAHGDGRDPERPGDLSTAELLDLPQDENRPLALAKAFQRLAQGQSQISTLSRLLRARPGILALVTLEEGRLPAPQTAGPAAVVVGRVDRQAIEPGPELAPGAETLQVSENPDEDLLGHVLAILARDPQEAEYAQDPPLMAVEKGLQGADLSVDGRLDQRLVGSVLITARGH